jgi:hypothetical protein
MKQGIGKRKKMWGHSILLNPDKENVVLRTVSRISKYERLIAVVS